MHTVSSENGIKHWSCALEEAWLRGLRCIKVSSLSVNAMLFNIAVANLLINQAENSLREPPHHVKSESAILHLQ